MFCPEAIESITIPSSVKHLADNAFYRSSIKEVKLGEGLLTIRGEVMVGGNVVQKGGFVVATISASQPTNG